MPSATGLMLLLPISVAALDIVRRLVRSSRERKGSSLPPGPTPIPLLGNALSVDIEEPWKTYTAWKATYGDVLYARLLDQEFVILNLQFDAVELLEKRSQIYSNRPFIATIDPYGLGFAFGFQGYGDHWRLCSRIFHQTFRANTALTFRPMQLRRAREMIMNIIDDPDRYASHYSTFSAAVALSAVYDYEPSPRNDPMVHIVERFLRAALPATSPEKAVLLKMFPFLLRIPDWLPGSSIKREARNACEWAVETVETPYQYAQERMKASQHPSFSMVSDHIARMQKFDEPYRSDYTTALKHASASAIIGSAETTSATIVMFTLAMVQNPHVWKRAQAEIDAVLGMERLPDFEDRPFLPYVEAVLRETQRWQPVLPLGIPHATTCSDIYKGLYIPKGATVVANIWAISRDEARYPYVIGKHNTCCVECSPDPEGTSAVVRSGSHVAGGTVCSSGHAEEGAEAEVGLEGVEGGRWVAPLGAYVNTFLVEGVVEGHYFVLDVTTREEAADRRTDALYKGKLQACIRDPRRRPLQRGQDLW